MIASNREFGKPGPPPTSSRLWYAPKAWLGRRAAAALAKRILEQIESKDPGADLLDEQNLFRALHACAYRAASRTARKTSTPARRSQWAERWRIIRDHVVEQNLPLVYSMLGRFNTRDLDHDDVLSEAMFGLSQAVERFNPWRGFRFSTYACHAIYRAMIRSSRSTSSYRRLFPVQHDTAFERPAEPSSKDALYVERLHRALDGNLGQLTLLESKILNKRFPTQLERRRLTLQQVGECVGLSKERVRQIQNQALAKLRAVLEADPALQ
ncbi:MAG: sigma-70 family RNA polymerase sigma factor [Phycisphaerae bacterium]